MDTARIAAGALFILLIVLVALGASFLLDRIEANAPLQLAPTPPPGHEIAVLSLRVTGPFDAPRMQLLNASVENSYAPQTEGTAGTFHVVLLRQGVLVYGFGATDPRALERQAPAVTATIPYKYHAVPAVDWNLIVPLQRDGVPLEFDEITIADAEDQPVLEVAVARDSSGRIVRFTQTGP